MRNINKELIMGNLGCDDTMPFVEVAEMKQIEIKVISDHIDYLIRTNPKSALIQDLMEILKIKTRVLKAYTSETISLIKAYYAI